MINVQNKQIVSTVKHNKLNMDANGIMKVNNVIICNSIKMSRGIGIMHIKNVMIIWIYVNNDIIKIKNKNMSLSCSQIMEVLFQFLQTTFVIFKFH